MYPPSASSKEAQYAHAILLFRDGNISQSLKTIDELIKKNPNNPYFQELKAQFLFESGRVKESAGAYRQALKLLPNAGLFKIGLAQSVLESSPNKSELNEIIALLNTEQIKNPSLIGWQLLARAYGEADNHSYSYYAAAEYNFGLDNIDGAKQQLLYAEKSNPSESLRLKISDLKKRIKDVTEEKY